MTRLDPVIRHAITAVSFEENKLHRERLVDELHANIPKKLIVIATPPGYGKTTLLADFTEHTELPVCWVRLSPADQDMIRFAQVLRASLERKFRRIKGTIDLESLIGSVPQAIARIFSDMIDEYIAETFAIVLDDVHLINSSPAMPTFLDALLETLPDQATLMTSGREVLNVGLARLMADGDLGGFGPPDLALNPEEIIQLAHLQSGLELSEEHANRLLDETKGWVTGLLLSGELSGGDLPSLVFDSRPMVYEYLASVVLNRQPEDLRRFLLDSAVLPIMTNDVCDEVLRREDSQKYLNRLVREGLFVSATSETPRTYEYHPQFREFLLESLASAEPARLKKLRQKAGALYARVNAPEQAVELFLEAKAPKKAARVAEKHAQALFTLGRWQTLSTWSEQLGNSEVAIPYVEISLAQALIKQGDTDAAEQACERGYRSLPEDAPKSQRIRAEITRGLIARRRGKARRVQAAVEAAESLISPRSPRVDKAALLRLKARVAIDIEQDLVKAEQLVLQACHLLERGGDLSGQIEALQQLAQIQVQQGRVRESHASDLRVHRLLENMGAPYPLGASFNNLGFHAHLDGRYQDALELLSEGLKYTRQAGSMYLETIVLFSLADVYSDLDLALQAAELYGQGLTLATRIDHTGLIRYGCVRTSQLHRRRESPALAHEWLRRALELDQGQGSDTSIDIHLSALEVSSRPEYVQVQLQDKLADVTLAATDRTMANYLLAKAYYRQGELDACKQQLEITLLEAGSTTTEQILAGELTFDTEFQEYVITRMAGNSVLAVIQRRIDTMRATAQQYKSAEFEEAIPGILQFKAMGGVEVHFDAGDPDELKPLAREVLFYLVDRGQVERDVLLEHFWPHHPPGRQVANLHTAIYSLRRALGKGAIQHEAAMYRLSEEHNWEYDVERFERAARVAESLPPGDPRRLFALTEAIHSYGGPFLPEFDTEWVFERRRLLELRYLDLLAHHAQEALVRNQPSRALTTLRDALEIDPLRDDTNRQYLEVLGRLGRRSDIVEHYQRYMRLLSSELGLDPPEDIRALYARLIG
jgi:ATP/maltotriose-dependent transcriptional regulator MalT/DNA-binding SARP family transcriptional activator